MHIWRKWTPRRVRDGGPLAAGLQEHQGAPSGAKKTRMMVMCYDFGTDVSNGCLVEEKEVDTPEELALPADPTTVTWVNVVGMDEVPVLERLGALFELHPLVVEDIVNRTQRPKIEDYESYVFFVLKSLYHIDEKLHVPMVEQVSLVLGPNYVLSFQEELGDEFEPIRAQMRNHGWRTRKLSADYLAYALMDLIVDQYFVVLERFGEQMEEVEEDLVMRPTTASLHGVYRLKREMTFLRRAIWPLREVVVGFERMDSPLIREPTKAYLRDLYDHTIQILEVVEAARDMLSEMMDIYMSSVSNRMNEVMKVLTVISTIFMPLTFIAGVYGMNFRHMPEIGWPWGYPFALGIMLGVTVVMIAYFRRKKWL